MEGWIPTQRLKKVVEFADKFCGNVEPIHRYIYLYFDKVLRVSMTDGCAVADMIFSKEFFPFEKSYKIPIQHLKGLLKGLKEEENPFVRMLALDEGLKIELEKMILNIESQNEERPVLKISNIKPFLNIPLKKFIEGLDFTSIQGMEGELIDFSTDESNNLWGVFNGYNMISYYNFGKSKESLFRSIPYVSIRHLIKSLSLISNENIHVFLNNESIRIKGTGYNINVCSAINPIRKNINIDNYQYNEIIKSELMDLRKLLNKIYTSLPMNAKAYIVFGKSSYIVAKDKNTTITWKFNEKFQNNYLVEIVPRKLRSILSRMKGELLINLNKDKILLKKDQKYLEIKVKEYKENN
jgi:hypothetical protein